MENIEEKVVKSLYNDKSKELINLMKECSISNGIIMMTMLGIGSHTEYYNVLFNRLNNQKSKIDDDLVKKEVLDILHEIDRNKDN